MAAAGGDGRPRGADRPAVWTLEQMRRGMQTPMRPPTPAMLGVIAEAARRADAFARLDDALQRLAIIEAREKALGRPRGLVRPLS